MSEELGLAKLVEFLNTTRRQAELSISSLNQRVVELMQDVEERDKSIKVLSEERDQFKKMVEQLKQENSQKWRLKERDDWKSLVDSLQRDRARIQDDCLRLELALEESKDAYNRVVEELEQLKEKSGNISTQLFQDQVESKEETENNENSSNHDDLTSSGNSNNGSSEAPLTPILIRRPNLTINTNVGSERDKITIAGTPHTMTRQLKMELEKAHTLMETERRKAENERKTQELEIMRLQTELSRFKTSSSQNSDKNVQNEQMSSNSHIIHNKKDSQQTAITTTNSTSSSSYWISSLINIIFPVSKPAATAINNGKPVILYV